MRKILWRCIANNMADLMMNEEIRDREVRVIDQNGEQLGVQPIRKALELAEEAGLTELEYSDRIAKLLGRE